MDMTKEIQQLRDALDLVKDFADVSYTIHLIEELERSLEDLKASFDKPTL